MLDVPEDEPIEQATQDSEPQSQSTPSKLVNGHTSNSTGTSADPDAQEELISTLRNQIQDLFSQVTQLNGKLVKSYDRVSDLEDDLHVTTTNLRSSNSKVTQLEQERTQHLSALDTGLLVEKAHVTAELTRLMEKATEEAAQRGQAESAKNNIEQELDDLSANLFDQANTMVAEARYARAVSERKVSEAETALKGAEDAVASMQKQMQLLQADKDDAEERAKQMELTVGKGKWPERQTLAPPPPTSRQLRLLNSHNPYFEFLSFVSHLRSLHPSSPAPPAMSTLLQLPFLTRIQNEDSDPTLRLDLAPSLNWLTRRSVLSAIYTGQLNIEPMSSAVLAHESSLGGSLNNINCALCGISIVPTEPDSTGRLPPPLHPLITGQNLTSLFRRQSVSVPASRSGTPTQKSNGAHSSPPSQVFVFRVTAPANQASSPPPAVRTFSISAFPSTSSSATPPPQHPSASHHTTTTTTTSSTIYPLCSGGWCLNRLRSTCTLWALVRTGIVEKIWEEEVPKAIISSEPEPQRPEKPVQVTPKKRGLWGMAAALGERAASWSESSSDKKQQQKILPPTPPPQHPALKQEPPTVVSPKPVVASGSVGAPPLPKRHHSRTRLASSPSPTSAQPPAEDAMSVEGDKSIYSQASEEPNGVHQVAERSAVEPPKVIEPAEAREPARVPLPDSRPVTPATPTFGVIDRPQASPTTPTFATSPSSASGGPPPPLPRRAAGRDKRMSLVNGLSRPATPSQLGKHSTDGVTEPKVESSAQEQAQPPETQFQAKAEETASVAPTSEPVKSEEKPDGAGITRPRGPRPPPVAPPPVEGANKDTTADEKDDETSDYEEANEEPPALAATNSNVSANGTDSTEHPDASVDTGSSPPAEGVPLEKEVPESSRASPSAAEDAERGIDAHTDSATHDTLSGATSEPAVPISDQIEQPTTNGTSATNNGLEHGNDAISNGHADERDAKEEPVPSSDSPVALEQPTQSEEARELDSSDELSGMYVGDKTWEERTWKELVRLREEMFWARVGSLQGATTTS